MTSRFVKTRDLADPEGSAACGEGRLWRRGGGRNGLTLTEEGQEHYLSAAVADGGLSLSVRAHPSIVEVTGITGTETEKTVEFTWEYGPPPEPVRACLEAVGGTDYGDGLGFGGEALFRLYDDGWRMSEVEWLARDLG